MSPLTEERLSELRREFTDLRDSLPPELPDDQGAVSAFYTSLSIAEVLELLSRTPTAAEAGVAVAWRWKEGESDPVWELAPFRPTAPDLITQPLYASPPIESEGREIREDQYPNEFLGRCGVCLDNAYLSKTPCQPSRAQGSPLFPEDCPIHRARADYARAALNQERT